MSQHTLHKYPIHNWFKTRLKQLGHNWDDPHQSASLSNEQAHRVLPSSRPKTSPQRDVPQSQFTQTELQPVEANSANSQTSLLGFLTIPIFPFVIPFWWRGSGSTPSMLKGIVLVFIGAVVFLSLLSIAAAQHLDSHDPRNHSTSANIEQNFLSERANSAANLETKLEKSAESNHRPGDHHPPITDLKSSSSNGETKKAKAKSEETSSDVNSSVANANIQQLAEAPTKYEDQYQLTIQVSPNAEWLGWWLLTIWALPVTLIVIVTFALLFILSSNIVNQWNNKKEKAETQDAIDPDISVEPDQEEQSTQTPTMLWQAGGHTRTGLVRKENQDAIRTGVTESGTAILVVCDGVGGEPGGAEAAQFAADFCLENLKSKLLDVVPDEQVCVDTLNECQKAFATQKVPGLTTAILALCHDAYVYYAILGDGGLDITHSDGMVQHCLAPHHSINAPSNVITAYLSNEKDERFIPRSGSVRCETGTLVLAMSDGASDHIATHQIGANLETYQALIGAHGIDHLARQLLLQLEAAKDPKTDILVHSDNMTLAIASNVGSSASDNRRR